MSDLILRTATRYLAPLLLLLSLFLLWRGHHEPGGGFAGGLVAATAFVLVALSDGPAAARRVLRISPRRLVAAGVAVSTLAGLAALLAGRPFLTGLWLPSAGAPSLGTPLLFDVGVYLTVIGVSSAILLGLVEEEA